MYKSQFPLQVICVVFTFNGELIETKNIYKIKNKKIALKIDVERHEKFVILGANEILTKNDVLLQIEIFDQMKVEVAMMLKKLNFNFIKSNGNDYFYSNFKILN